LERLVGNWASFLTFHWVQFDEQAEINNKPWKSIFKYSRDMSPNSWEFYNFELKFFWRFLLKLDNLTNILNIQKEIGTRFKMLENTKNSKLDLKFRIEKLSDYRKRTKFKFQKCQDRFRIRRCIVHQIRKIFEHLDFRKFQMSENISYFQLWMRSVTNNFGKWLRKKVVHTHKNSI